MNFLSSINCWCSWEPTIICNLYQSSQLDWVFFFLFIIRQLKDISEPSNLLNTGVKIFYKINLSHLEVIMSRTKLNYSSFQIPFLWYSWQPFFHIPCRDIYHFLGLFNFHSHNQDFICFLLLIIEKFLFSWNNAFGLNLKFDWSLCCCLSN